MYSFRVYLWLEALTNEVEKHVRNLIWSGDSEHRKLVNVSWKETYKPLNEGGLGL